MAGGERGLGDVDAHAAAGAGDEPGLLLGGHGVQQSADLEKVGVPVERGTGRVPQARVAGSTLAFVETKQEIREFLTSRRARVTPEQAGLPTYGARRVPGLRREEVAVLAGVSIPYYTRLERGDMSGASEGVLEALARALQLDDAERAHLFDLARAAQPAGARPRRRQAKPRIRPEIQWTLDAITGAAAYVGNDRLDILATNQLGRALFSELYAAPARPANLARFVFLDPRAETFYADWDRAARETAAILRSAAGRDPHDRDLSDLVGELATQSEAFRTHWAAHNVRFHATARQALPPPRRRRAQPQLQPPGHRRRPRAHALHLRRRTRLSLRGGAEPARKLGGHGRPRRAGADDRPKLSPERDPEAVRIC